VLRGQWQLRVTTPRFSIGSAEEFYALTSVEPFFDIGSSLEGSFGDRFRINFAGLLVRKDGKVLKKHFTIGGDTPWGPADQLLIR
jgi:hypothetical protein